MAKRFTHYLLTILCIAISVGTAAAAFLYALQWATMTRESNNILIFFLPIAGILIAWLYKKFGQSVEAGNNLLIQYVLGKADQVPWKMAPLIFLTTITTHLFGGSAGREGTALQMAGGLATPFINLFPSTRQDRKIFMLSAIGAGFSAVFGTPLAGCIFALEFFRSGKIYVKGIIPVLMTSLLANMVAHAWHAQHTIYIIKQLPTITISNILYALLAGIFFGICGWIFCITLQGVQKLASLTCSSTLVRPLFGGAIVVIAYLLIGNTRYLGLGVPVIQEAFETHVAYYDFILKLLLTCITLGFGFKGGEVTPLFFIGATLGNALSLFLPLPMSMLAGMGFVAVFAGATNTPLACTIMGVELFGLEGGLFIAIGCFTAYLFSGNRSIYKSQEIGWDKYQIIKRLFYPNA